MSLMDPTFKYVKSGETDIRKTFARIRRQMKEAAEQPKKPPTVRPIRAAKAGKP